MHRSDGLVQRRVANTGSNGNGSGGTESTGVDDGGEPAVNGDYDSSKDTRFTLMEEVLLLGLKDKEVCIPSFALASSLSLLSFNTGIHFFLERLHLHRLARLHTD